jgi:predicted nuclease of predicted toxin-antitoxin system
MTLRFYADHYVSNSTIRTLRSSGYDVIRLRDHIPPDSPDSVVVSKAQELDAILLSLNGDFSDIALIVGPLGPHSRGGIRIVLKGKK